MVRAAVLWLLCVAPQDPDRSTPEKAFENFIAFWSRIRDEGELWMKMMSEIDAMAEFSRTEAFKKKKADQNAEMSKSREEWKTPPSTYSIASKAEQKDGTVVLEITEKARRKKTNFETHKVEEYEESLQHRYAFQKVGAHWLVREIWRACFGCSGKGVCLSCEGTGKSEEEECWACKGAKKCESCKGEKLVKEDLEDANIPLLIADAEPTFSTDLSSPKAAAQTLADLATRQALHQSKMLRKFVDDVITHFRVYLIPDLVKKIEDTVAKAVENGKQAYQNDRPRAGAIEEEGDTAYVVIISTFSMMGEKREQKERFVLKNTGNQWLVDGVQMSCWGCEGSGKCGSCKGEGKMNDQECFACNGKKSCGQCKGSGWVGQDQP